MELEERQQGRTLRIKKQVGRCIKKKRPLGSLELKSYKTLPILHS